MNHRRSQLSRVSARGGRLSAADKIQLALVGIQALTLILAIVVYFTQVAPAFERDRLREDVNILQKRKDEITADYMEAIAEALILRDDIIVQSLPNPFTSGNAEVSVESLARSWPPSPEMRAYKALNELRAGTMKEIAPRLSQAEIDAQVDTLLKRIREQARPLRCNVDLTQWADSFNAARAVIEFDVTACVDGRLRTYQSAIRPPIEKKVLSKRLTDADVHLREDFTRTCYEGHLEELVLKHNKAWNDARTGCAERMEDLEAILQGRAVLRREPFVARLPDDPVESGTPESVDAARARALAELRGSALELVRKRVRQRGQTGSTDTKK